MQRLDILIVEIDKLIRMAAGITQATRPNPAQRLPDNALSESERKHSAGLMRVNHVGEVCAQALYDSQGKFSRNNAIKQQFKQSADEERDHLAWTAQRLQELGSRTSALNPLWYGGSYLLGAVAARSGDAYSLGFVVETERQVEAHLASHLQKLPLQDEKSRAIVNQMRHDEAEHGAKAHLMGAASIPAPISKLMKIMAKVMTTTAYYI